MTSITPVAAEMIRRLDAGDEVVCVWSGLGCGKSRGVIDASLVLCHTRQVIDQVTGERSPMRILIAAESMTKLRQNLMLEAEEAFTNIKGASFHADPLYPRWQFANGATVAFRGFKVFPSGKNSIEGQKFAIIFSDETQELPSEWFQVSIARARLPNVNNYNGKTYSGQTVWLGYPQADDRFLRDAKRRQADGTPVSFLHFRSSSNPWLPADYEDKQRRNYSTRQEWEAVCQLVPGATFPARHSYYGQVVSPALYPEGNLIDLPVDKNIETWVSIDPGRFTYSALFWQYRKVGSGMKAVIVDEYAPTGEPITDQHAIGAIAARGYNIRGVVIDPFAGAQAGRQAHGTSTVQLYQRRPHDNPDGLGGGLGVPVSVPSGRRTSVEDGIARTRARLCDVEGNRSILIREALWSSPTSDRGIRFAIQNFAPAPDGKPNKSKGSASELASHVADALRYFVADQLWDGMPDINPTPTPPRPVLTRDQVRPAPHRV